MDTGNKLEATDGKNLPQHLLSARHGGLAVNKMALGELKCQWRKQTINKLCLMGGVQMVTQDN